MDTENPMNDVGHGIPANAVSLYGTESGAEDFPVLKAFQQYIDAEQAKARKRLMTVATFFAILMFAVIAVFVTLLMLSTQRNQALNDKILEIVMKDRNQGSSAVVVQPPQDNATVLALTSKLEAMQRKMDDDRRKYDEERQQKAVAEEKARADAAEAAKIAAEKAAAEAAQRGPTPQELEIKRLNTLLELEKAKAKAAAEKKNAEIEKERQHQAELEEYRRKHYPKAYEKKSPAKKSKTSVAPSRPKAVPVKPNAIDVYDEDDDELDDEDSISYYDDEEDEESPQKDDYLIPVDVKGSNSAWKIPRD